MKAYKEVYLVDDFDTVNMLHSILLRKLVAKAEVKTYTNPQLALTDLRMTIQEQERVLVLLDINMPAMNGFEFLEVMVLEKFPITVDVIIVTSSISSREKALALKYSKYVRDYVTKPLKSEGLKFILTNIPGTV
ncbi:two-component system response regulator [Maribacter sp. 2307UL18-2]|uniref:response regulator n=1 Tax=Maribacter sp. 2307UL18-2 TaxID=3386274 RepID=UPI0039BC4CB1